VNRLALRFLAAAVGMTAMTACATAQQAATVPAPPQAQAAPAEQAPLPAEPERRPDVHFVPTPHETVKAMLDVTHVGPQDVVYDLGSGDGRIAIAAAKRGARAVGIDIDPRRVEEARANAEQAQVTDRVRFILGDLFEHDLSQATVITLYLLPSLNLKLRPTLLALRPGTRIVSHNFDMGDWQPEQTLRVGHSTVYYWTVPARSAQRPQAGAAR
jgi:SAM-dependent methyltransferase